MDNTTFKDVPNTIGYASNNDGLLGKATTGAHAAVNSVADAADVAARKTKPAIDHVAAMAHEVVNSTAATAAPAADWISDKGHALKARQERLVEDTSTYITANPFKSVGMAVVAGFLISRLIRR